MTDEVAQFITKMKTDDTTFRPAKRGPVYRINRYGDLCFIRTFPSLKAYAEGQKPSCEEFRLIPNASSAE